jgi:hypothetical protein
MGEGPAGGEESKSYFAHQLFSVKQRRKEKKKKEEKEKDKRK